MPHSLRLRTAIAAHRFGLGEASLVALPGDPLEWLDAQIGPADAALGDGLLSTGQALKRLAAERELRQQASSPAPGMPTEQTLAAQIRETASADSRSRVLTAVTTRRPFAERLQLFWANHFTVSLAKGSSRGLVGAFERDAIRPNIAGSFATLLLASTTHPAMLRYLDNSQSAGPNSRAAERATRRSALRNETPRVTGLNENLAREVLELHTLGAESGRGAGNVYTQDDVTSLSRVLTGWRVDLQRSDPTQAFDSNWHEPGRKTLLGKTYPQGPGALHEVLHDLALHPATARFIATKLARHFIADDPPPALVDRLAATYLREGAALPPVYRELIRHPLAWTPQTLKLKTPEEFVVSTARVLSLETRLFERGSDVNASGMQMLGQHLQTAPSPAGWSDRAADWLGPDAVWKRVEWATRVAARLPSSVDARALAEQSFGPLLGADTQRQIDRAADGPQAVALLLLSPEFQRR